MNFRQSCQIITPNNGANMIEFRRWLHGDYKWFGLDQLLRHLNFIQKRMFINSYQLLSILTYTQIWCIINNFIDYITILFFFLFCSGVESFVGAGLGVAVYTKMLLSYIWWFIDFIFHRSGECTVSSEIELLSFEV